jgi:hypothetical protein
MNKFHNSKITPEMVTAANDFIKALFHGSLEEYWNVLSDIDQATIYAHYSYIKASRLDDYDGFADYLGQNREEDREDFARLREHCGISNWVKYSPCGDVYLKLFENIRGEVHVIVPTPVDAMPLRLTAQTQFIEEPLGYTLCWKVRLVDMEIKTVLNV